MNLVTSIYTLDELKRLKDKLDYALIHIPFYSVNYKDIDIDMALDYCEKNKIKPILSLNRIFHPGNLDGVAEIINKYKNTDCMFYIADLGALNLFIKAGIISRVIYNPETMITNFLDMNEYSSLGVDACGISNEITINDLNKISEVNNNIYYQVFGKRLMFYSRRKLVTLYGEKNGEVYPKSDIYLRESTRTDYFPIIENENGTLIYRSYNISLLPYIDALNIKYAYIESFDIDIDKFEAVNSIFYDELKIEDGFIYKDSIYQKEEF